MNIYIHIEIAARELDSKILLAVIAASRGHDVLISDIGTISNGIKSGCLTPGVFHTKSLAPSDKKIARHQYFIDKGFCITSIDEEGGLLDYGYEKFAQIRYSEKTISQAAAVFSWGNEDSETLKRIYSNHAHKINKTGSPRVDLWKQQFLGFWSAPASLPCKPFLLVSSNMGYSNYQKPFHEFIKFNRSAGYFQRDPELFGWYFRSAAQDFHMTLAFTEAIQFLTSQNDDFDIVLRPHPSENMEAWKIYLEGIPNVHIIREGSITAWVNNAFAVLHNGCTTALEATISGQPVITYLPFDEEYKNEIPNQLGYRVKTHEELLRAVNQYLELSRSKKKYDESKSLPESILKKVHIDGAELAAEKIVKIWENLGGQELTHPAKWRRLRLMHMKMTVKHKIRTLLEKVFPTRFPVLSKNYKFLPLNEVDIRDRVSRIQQALELEGPLECKLLSERAVQIRKKPRNFI